jgi:hypothetical protein
MRSERKRILVRIAFWGAIAGAPVVFFAMACIYLNAYLTGDRVAAVINPVLQVLSERNVSIAETNFEFGTTSTLRLRGVEFTRHDTVGGLPRVVTDARIDRLTMRFRPLTIFTRVVEIDTLSLEGMEGTVRIARDFSFRRITVRDEERGTEMQISLGTGDMENFLIRVLRIEGSDLQFEDEKRGIRLEMERFAYTARIEGFRVMRTILTEGEFAATLHDRNIPGKSVAIRIEGRVQFNLDDNTFVLRGGVCAIDGAEYPFTAVMPGGTEIPTVKVLLQHSESEVQSDLYKLPASIREFLAGSGDDAPYRIQLIFSDADDPAQT